MGFQYGKADKSGISLERDCYGEHFDTKVKFNYMLSMNGDVIDEDDNPAALAKRIYAMIERLHTIYAHLNRLKLVKDPTDDQR